LYLLRFGDLLEHFKRHPLRDELVNCTVTHLRDC
jgi:hypothetical protein